MFGSSRNPASEIRPADILKTTRKTNYYARRYDEAGRTGRIAIELTLDSPYTCFYLACLWPRA